MPTTYVQECIILYTIIICFCFYHESVQVSSYEFQWILFMSRSALCTLIYVHPALADSLLHILCYVASTYGPYGFPLYTINMQGVCERIHAVLPGEFTIIIYDSKYACRKPHNSIYAGYKRAGFCSTVYIVKCNRPSE